MEDRDKWLDINTEKLYEFAKGKNPEDCPVRLYLRSRISYNLYELLNIKFIRVDKNFVFKEDIDKINLEDFQFINKNTSDRDGETFIIDEVLTYILWDLHNYIEFISEKYELGEVIDSEDVCRGVNVFNAILEKVDDIESVKDRLSLISFFLDDGVLALLYHKSTSKRNQLQEKKQILQNILDKENEAVKENKNPLLIEGKAPNILERYVIANKLLNIDTTISKLNIKSEDKSILLAQIMGCSKQVARELINGTYNGRAKIRTSTIDNYISNLKK